MIAGSYPTGTGASTNICQNALPGLVVEVPRRARHSAVHVSCVGVQYVTDTKGDCSRCARLVAVGPGRDPSDERRAVPDPVGVEDPATRASSGVHRSRRRPDDLVCQLDERQERRPRGRSSTG